MLPRVERIERNLMYRGAILEIYRDTMRLPDGRSEYFDFVKHKGAAAVVPVLEDGRILMVRQYRNAIDDYTLEIPAGAKNSIDEETLDCAHRELEEETGYRAEKEDMSFLIGMYTTVALCNEKIDIYLAKNLKKTRQHLDDDEFIDVSAYTVEELTDKIRKGEIVDGKTIAGLMSARAMGFI
ncbi:MAG TPA: NUDIX hydrolase [Lachnospiraceae bacterium]|nr:NUDIX hydrolase [Lachnospiraceae bacterium]